MATKMLAKHLNVTIKESQRLRNQILMQQCYDSLTKDKQNCHSRQIVDPPNEIRNLYIKIVEFTEKVNSMRFIKLTTVETCSINANELFVRTFSWANISQS